MTEKNKSAHYFSLFLFCRILACSIHGMMQAEQERVLTKNRDACFTRNMVHYFYCVN